MVFEPPGHELARRATGKADVVREAPPLLLVIVLAIVVRVPFWLEALRTPLDGDEAIVGLMARHLDHAATIWGQSFGSPVEPALAAPFVAALGPTAAALRIPYFVVGVLLVVVTYLIAKSLDARAAVPAGVLMACPSPYLILHASLTPTTYPGALLLSGVLLLLALRIGRRLAAGQAPRLLLVVWGGLAGVTIWTHLMTASVVVACLAYFYLVSRRRVSVPLLAAAMTLVTSAPWWIQGWSQALRIVQLSGPGRPMAPHLGQSLRNLVTAAGGLIGTRTPLIADDPSYVVTPPHGFAVLVVVAYALPLAYAVYLSRRRSDLGLMLAVIALAMLAFPFPQRSGPHTIRHLTAAYVPLTVAIAFAAASLDRRARVWVVVLTIMALNLVGATRLLAAWRSADRAAAPFLLPDLNPVLHALEARGIRRAYASYGPAYRLTYASDERIIVSQPWNERFRHYPLPYLDEVRFSKNVAWIITPTMPSDLPTPERFEATVQATGGRCDRIQAGPAFIYFDFVPPFGATVETWPGGGLAGDGDLATSVIPDPTRPTILRLPSARRLDAITLVAPFHGPRLPRSMTVEISADGAEFEVVDRRQRREERLDLRWVGGHPQAVLDHDLIAIPLGGRVVAALRITPDPSQGAWSLGEVLLHPAAAEGQRVPWNEWLEPALSWNGRARVLAEQPHVDREDWFWRMLLASRAHPQ